MRDKQPITPVGWLIAFIIIAITFIVYYSFGYEIMSREYEDNFWYSSQYNDPTHKTTMRVHIPQYVADYVDREIVVEISNADNIEKSIQVIVKANIYTGEDDPLGNEKGCVANILDKPFVYISSQQNNILKGDNFQGSSTIELEIPPYGSSTTNLWIHVKPSVADANGSCVVLQFYILSDKGDASGLICEVNNENQQICSVRFENVPSGKFYVKFDRIETLRHSAIGEMLLSPWSNIFIIPFALFIVWFAETIGKAFLGWFNKKV